ncbi:MAG: formate dehydrogenase accessory sulfurtransferase FdhD [Archaeoglobaceae archaeon]|nr:formate dehydrogenase accessory sulfurtransferase FdhD [Archaeoglobaceae archaeon]
MIREIGKTLEIAVEREVEFVINGKVYRKLCTPTMLKEFVVGFLVSEGVVKSLKDFKVEIVNDRVEVEVFGKTSDLSLLFSGFLREGKFERVESKRKFDLEELRKKLDLIEIEEYKRTRGYHVAVVVTHKEFYRAYDVGRYNAIDKAIGLALLKGANLQDSFLLLSGRISKEVVQKALNARIPLVVSKAAIFDSAIDFCKRTGLSAVSFATNIAIGNAIK